MSVLELRNITKSFGANKVLTDVNMKFEEGEIHSIIGENGAGKSTLMKIIGGIYRADSGEVILDGKDVVMHSPIEAYEHGIGIVHQELSIVGNMTVAQNVFVNCEPVYKAGFINWKKMNSEAKAALAEVGADIDPEEIAGNLSVGMQQIVEIAKVIAKKVRILILDEPTSALSDKEVDRLFQILDDLRRKGVSIIFISHKLNEIIRISDKVSVLRDGIRTGTLLRDEMNEPTIIKMMVGRDLGRLYPPRASSRDGEIVLDCKGLSLRNKFSNIDFFLKKGEILGVFGLVGAGRTEVALSVFGADNLDSGKVLLNGKSVSFKNPSDAVSHGVCYLSEDRKVAGLFVNMEVRENVVSACLKTVCNKAGFLNQGAIGKITQDYINELDVHPSNCSRFRIRNLSGGNQQKILFAKWLAAKPTVLIVDEPTRGVDVGAKSMIHSILRNLAESGMAIMMISSELPEILGVSDRVMVMSEGRKTADFEAEGLTEETVMNAVFNTDGGLR